VIDHDALGRIDEYLRHRLERERQIVAVLTLAAARSRSQSESDPSSWRSSWEIMKAIYPPTLPFSTQISAQWNVCHHLEKLQTEGTILRAWPDMWRVRSSASS
jgi:hypothetical protein